MFMLGLSATIHQLAMANSVRWHGNVLRMDDGHVLRMVFHFEVECQRKKRRLKRTLKRQVEEESVRIGLRRKEALRRSMWSVSVKQIAAGLRRFWSSSLVGDTTRF